MILHLTLFIDYYGFFNTRQDHKENKVTWGALLKQVIDKACYNMKNYKLTKTCHLSLQNLWWRRITWNNSPKINDYKNAFYTNPLYRNYLFDGKKILRYCCLNWFNMVYLTSHTYIKLWSKLMFANVTLLFI